MNIITKIVHTKNNNKTNHKIMVQQNLYRHLSPLYLSPSLSDLCFSLVDKFNVVELELTNINNPNEDGGCQYFDPSRLASTINSITKQRVMVTKVSGSNLCDLSPCSPSPCQNGGTCSLEEGVVGGYECACRQGYMGLNCTLDVNECELGERKF